MPETSIIIRTYNRPYLLRRALLGILKQSKPVGEILIVNNGGKPVDLPFLESVCGQANAGNAQNGIDPRIQVLELPVPVSLGAAANVGLRKASGEWAAIHDDDDYWPIHHVRDTRKFLEQSPSNLVLLGSFVDLITERLNENGAPLQDLSRSSLHAGFQPGPIPMDQILQHNLLPPIALWYRRDALLEVGGYAEDVPVLEDWVANRALLLTGPGWFRSGIPVEYRVRENPPEDSLGNTVTQRREQHEQTAQLLRDRWLREELTAGRFGPESFARLSRQLKEQGDRLDLIQRLKSGIRRRLGKKSG